MSEQIPNVDLNDFLNKARELKLSEKIFKTEELNNFIEKRTFDIKIDFDFHSNCILYSILLEIDPDYALLFFILNENITNNRCDLYNKLIKYFQTNTLSLLAFQNYELEDNFNITLLDILFSTFKFDRKTYKMNLSLALSLFEIGTSLSEIDLISEKISSFYFERFNLKSDLKQIYSKEALYQLTTIILIFNRDLSINNNNNKLNIPIIENILRYLNDEKSFENKIIESSFINISNKKLFKFSRTKIKTEPTNILIRKEDGKEKTFNLIFYKAVCIILKDNKVYGIFKFFNKKLIKFNNKNNIIQMEVCVLYKNKNTFISHKIYKNFSITFFKEAEYTNIKKYLSDLI